MSAGLARLNALPPEDARAALLRCCGARRWSAAMEARRPFATEDALRSAADDVWRALSEPDWLEAFAAHPRIGSHRDVSRLSAEARAWAEREQAGASSASSAGAEALAEANAAYEARFGYLFIVCATGKTADEMLALCRARLAGAPERELSIAAEEQRKITARLRLDKLLSEEDREMSPITTHVLDTARGKPAEGIAIRLEVQEGTSWRELGAGVTDADGRVRTLLPPGAPLARARYRLTFETERYLRQQHGAEVFFPEVTVAFVVHDPSAHHHVPLLLSPFAFSTYRGS